MSSLTDLFPHPIVQAPMAGGVSVPRLAAAVSDAGGLGFLAAGYKTADGLYQEIKQIRGLTARPFGVNLFLPQPEYGDPAAVEVYAHQLAGDRRLADARRTGQADRGGAAGVPEQPCGELVEALGAWQAGAVTNADLGFETLRRAEQAPERLREQRLVDVAVGLVAARMAVTTDMAALMLRESAERAGVSESEAACVARVLLA